MNIFFLFPFTLTAIISAASPVRYLDNVFTTVSVSSNIVYGANTNVDGSPQTLSLDLYQPLGDTAKARPLVVFLFGGGFAVGTKTDGDMVLLSQTFAKKGYVAASIQYRLDLGLLNTKPLVELGIAEFRGMQDAKAAIRFLRAHKAEYKIDDSRIFIGGCSAGAMISLEVAFLDANEISTFIDTGKVGGLEGNSGTPGVSSAVNGVINNWGAVQDSAWLLNNDIPVICTAGTADPEVPYDHNANFCGSACINRVLARRGVRTVLKPFIGMGHGMGTGDPRYDTLLTMTSQFAYEVLFKSNTTSLPKVKHAFTQAARARGEFVALTPAFGLPNAASFPAATIRSLQGRAIGNPKGNGLGDDSKLPGGIFFVQP